MTHGITDKVVGMSEDGGTGAPGLVETILGTGMRSGTDVALENAGMVLMTNNIIINQSNQRTYCQSQLRPDQKEKLRNVSWLRLETNFRTFFSHDKSPNTSPNTLAGQSLGLGDKNR